jgi:hypothetical protein
MNLRRVLFLPPNPRKRRADDSTSDHGGATADTVAVDGRILRRNGKFAALDDRKVARDAIESSAALRAHANWP